MPFFSIITCTYNSATFIEDNLKSVKNQKYKNFEHIFIDGFSNDGTYEILKKYAEKEKNAKIIQVPANGIANAMNIGIKNASGDYLLFLNSDDFLSNNNALQNVFNFIIKNKNYSWYYGIVNTINREKESLYFYPHKWYQKKYIYWLFRFIFFMQHPAVFYSKELFKKYGLYDESSNAMDYEYAVRIGKKEKAKFMDIVISNFRIGGFSTTNTEAMEKEVVKIIKKYYKFPKLWLFVRKIYIKSFR
ncbi:glycosyltransferase [bacterium]|nr:glycosyltransferase [bacterium]